jgi:4-hydroxy-3-polyprenylbenzoate decarboxylase
MGLVATNKWPGETQRELGRTVTMNAQMQQRMDGVFEVLGL